MGSLVFQTRTRRRIFLFFFGVALLKENTTTSLIGPAAPDWPKTPQHCSKATHKTVKCEGSVSRKLQTEGLACCFLDNLDPTYPELKPPEVRLQNRVAGDVQSELHQFLLSPTLKPLTWPSEPEFSSIRSMVVVVWDWVLGEGQVTDPPSSLPLPGSGHMKKANPGLAEPLPATVGTITILLPSCRFHVSCCSLRPPPLPLPSPPQCEGASPASVLHRALSPPSQRLTVRLDSPNTFLTLSLPPLRSLSPSLFLALLQRSYRVQSSHSWIPSEDTFLFQKVKWISSQLLQFCGTLFTSTLFFTLFFHCKMC